MKKLMKYLYSPLLLACLLSTAVGSTAAEELVLDAVVASVDGNPITLSDLSERLPKKRSVTLQDAATDPEVKFMLDSIIMETLIKAEAKEKQVRVIPQEIESYIDEVASRNELSRKEFEHALQQEHKSIEEYRKRIELEILKSKLAASLLKGGVSVSEEDIQDYIDNNPGLTKSGAKVKLGQILISNSERSADEVRSLASEIQEQLREGEDFEDLAREYSASPEAAEGGLLGVIAEEDLNPIIFDAIFGLEEGDVSDIVESPAGAHLFKVEKRYLAKDESNEELVEEVREILRKRQLETRMQTYFTRDLFTTHAVDKKI